MTGGRYFGWVVIGVCLLLGLPTRATASQLDLLHHHRQVMSEVAECFSRSSVRINSLEGDPQDGKHRIRYCQDGLFRLELSWLGFTEVFAYDGREYWYGSELSLPYRLDFGHGLDITAQLISNFTYLQPGHAEHLSLADNAPLNLAERYPVIRFAAPAMSEALLLLNPADLRLAGMLQGNERQLSDSVIYKLTWFDNWQEFAATQYPAVIRQQTLNQAGELQRERVLKTQSVVTAPRLPEVRFRRDSAPAIQQPQLPTEPFIVPFEHQQGKVVLNCKGPGGEPLRLALDTGANVGLLSKQAVQKLGLELSGEELIRGHGGTAEVKYARVNDVSLLGEHGRAGLTLPAYPAAVITSSNEFEDSLVARGIDGLLGTSLLNSYVVRLDYRNQELSLYPPASFDAQTHLEPGYHPIRANRDAIPWVEVNVDGKLSGGAFFNSGAQQYFTLAIWALDQAQISYPVETIGTGSTVGGSTWFGIIRPDWVEINGMIIEHPRTHLEMLAPIEAPNPHRIASFGNEFFSGKAVTFDLFSEMFYLED